LRLTGQSPTRLIGILLLLASVPLLLWQADPARQLPVSEPAFLAAHSMMETFAIVVAALIFFTGHGTWESARSLRSVLLGYSFLAVALFDMLHFLSYIGMPPLVSSNSAHKAILFWLCGRLMAGLGLLGYILVPERLAGGPHARGLALVLSLAIVIGCASVFLPEPAAAPAMYVPGQGLTALKVALEWLVFGIYLGGAAVLFLRRGTIANCDIESLLLALLLLAAGELFFTVYVQVSSTTNLLGHIYKVFAYYFLYRALYAEAVRQPFRRMRWMLTHDELTKLPNRTAFNERLEAVVAQAKQNGGVCAVLLMDLDRFQAVNDTLGHEQGDALLISVARRIQDHLPPSAYVARFGGDEFIILLEGAAVEDARRIGEGLLHTIGSPFELGADRLDIGASLGIVTCPTDGDSVSLLMRHADLALHRAKASGRNCLAVFSRDLSEEMQRRVLLESRLKQVLQSGELYLHYQPKTELRDGHIVGWEALLRWHSAELGVVSPEEFIPVAEQSGMILPIGDWALREACRQMREWQQAGLSPGTMAVNLSTRQFRQKDLAQEVQVALRDTGLAPTSLELEITESAIMDNLSSAAAVLAELESLGIAIAIDDFGTGYSSLSYLKTFSLHSLKIDRSFIRDIPNDENDTAIVRAIITLANSLGLSVVAEGVETEQQLAYLRHAGCAQMQGYLFSRPLAADRCAELMRTQRRIAG
jgi:diguanylate cyclase (GGDEF)-like protein